MIIINISQEKYLSFVKNIFLAYVWEGIGMQVIIFLPTMGLRGEQVLGEDLPHSLQSKRDQEAAEDNKLFSQRLLENALLKEYLISTFINDGRYCVQCTFSYVVDSRELINRTITAKPAASGDDKGWSVCWGGKTEKLNPIGRCRSAQDRARYVNEASRIFVQMRDVLSRGLLKIPYIGQLDKVEYLLDNLGRYEVVNFYKLSIAASYAIACNAIF